MTTLYGCSICGTYFLSEEELTEHLEKVHKIRGDDIEGHYLIVSGLTRDQAEEMLRSQERTVEALSELPEEEVKESYPYYPPYHYPYGIYGYPEVRPYYYYRYPVPEGYTPTPIKGIFRKNNTFYCAIHGKRFNSLKTLLDHLKKMHPKTDYILGLKMALREKYYYVAKLQGRNITEEEVNKMSDQELLGRIFREYFTKPEEIERLGQLVKDRLEKLGKFLKNETSICPICSKTLLDVDNTLLSGFKIPKGIDHYVTRLNFLGEEIKADLRKVTHLASRHPVTFRSLVENGLLSGTGINTLIKNLTNREKNPKERVKENLMKAWIDSKDRTPLNTKLTKEEKMWIWLKKERHEKERTYSRS